MKTVVVDVRTRKEFLEGSYPGAVNIPSNAFDVSRFAHYAGHHISLVCNSGNRAGKVKTLLEQGGFEHVTLMQHQIAHLEEGLKANESIWTVDRQFRLALGILLGIFLVGNYIFNSPFSLVLLLIVFSGLIYSAITDNCYLKMLIASLPWNRTKSNESTSAQFGIQPA